MTIAEQLQAGELTYADLPEGACRRFKARSLDGERTGYGMAHPDGSAVIQWGNLAARHGDAFELFATEADWRPLCAAFDEGLGPDKWGASY